MIDQINRRFVVVNEKMNGGGVGGESNTRKNDCIVGEISSSIGNKSKRKNEYNKNQKPNHPDGANTSRPKKPTKAEKKSARPSWEGVSHKG